MNRNVLIIDDDQEFTSLLRGIFEQAGYNVLGAFDAEQGLNIIKNQPMDLLVTDQRLPGGMSGIDLIHKLREMNKTLPVIMVSGFLNDDAIRDLIRNGVEGVFIKPLNIFSLLKKASEILDRKSNTQGGDSDSGARVEASGDETPVGGIQGLSVKGRNFLKRAHEASSFRRNLLLIGPVGTLFEGIGRDIIRLSNDQERCCIFKPGSLSTESLQSPFAGEDADKPVAFIILDTEQLSVEEVDRVIAVADEKGGSESSLRIIFCLSKSMEDLYDAGKIDEELYLFLGTNELQIPALKEMPEDLIAIARDEIANQTGGASLDARLRTLLLDHDWPENMLELKSVIVRAVNNAQPLAPGAKHFQAALNPEKAGKCQPSDPRSTVERFLDQEKSRYIKALEILNLS